MTNKFIIASNTLLLALLVVATTPSSSAQTTPDPHAAGSSPNPSAHDPDTWPVHTFYLKTADRQTAGDEYEAVRGVLSAGGRITPIFSQNEIVTRVNPTDIPRIEQVLSDIERPNKSYRVTYTFTEMDNDKGIGTQHFAMVMVSGQETRLRQGSKVPLVSATYNTGNASGSTGNNTPAGIQTQVTYQDIGINLDATLQELGADGRLRFDVEQSSLAPDTSRVGPQDPIIRQTSLKGEATLAPNKPLKLGSIDIPGSTRRLDVEVLMEPLP